MNRFLMVSLAPGTQYEKDIETAQSPRPAKIGYGRLPSKLFRESRKTPVTVRQLSAHHHGFYSLGIAFHQLAEFAVVIRPGASNDLAQLFYIGLTQLCIFHLQER